MKSVLHVRSTFLDKLCSTTAGQLPHGVLEHCHPEITTSASQVEACLQAALAEQLPENHNIVDQIGAYNDVPNTSPNKDAEADLMPMFADSVRIISCLEVICG